MESEREPAEGCFVEVGGMKLVFDPSKRDDASKRKHPCPDCRFCQLCSDSRCHSCRDEKRRGKRPADRKLSLLEQIELYDEINGRGKRACSSRRQTDKLDEEDGC